MLKRKTRLSICFGIGLTLCLQFVAAQPTTPAELQSYAVIPVAAREPAPDFILTDLQGHRLTLSQYRGKVVLLDFWAVDCGGCKIEIPWYVDFDQKYRQQGLALIGLDMYGETPAKIRSFMAKSHMDYPVAVGTDALGSQFHLTEMPLTLLIDRKGRIAVTHAGIVDRAQFDNDIRALLAARD